MILIRKSIPFVAFKTISDLNGRYIIVVRKLNNTPVILACVYAPNGDDPKFKNKFFSSLLYLDTHRLILSGDFNCAMNPLLDKSSSKPTIISQTSKCIRGFLESYVLSDPW